MRGPDRMPDEARRYDGAPAPKRNAGVTAGDMKAAAREAKENAECDECGEGDWDDLTRVADRYEHSCPAHQNARPEPTLLCQDCLADHNPEAEWRGEQQRLATREETPRVIFECGISQRAEPGEGPEGPTPPHSHFPARLPAECRCGARIETILYPEDEDDDSDNGGEN